MMDIIYTVFNVRLFSEIETHLNQSHMVFNFNLQSSKLKYSSNHTGQSFFHLIMIGLNPGKLRNRRETADPDMLQGTVKELISHSDIIGWAKLNFR